MNSKLYMACTVVIVPTAEIVLRYQPFLHLFKIGDKKSFEFRSVVRP